MNLNDQVEVKLTDYGLKIYNDYWEGLDLKKYGLEVPELNNNILKTELWDLMHIFSKYIYMGNTEVPFENNEIKIIWEVV